MSRIVRSADLLVVPVRCKDAAGDGVSGHTAYALFTAPQSLLAYGVAICVVATITRAARTILRTEADSILVPFVASVAVGCAILVMVAADRRTRPRGGLEWTAAVLVAWVNSLVLFTAALGIDKF